MNLNCTFETRKKRDGSIYKVVVIKLTENVEKLVFLDKAELELLELTSKIKFPQGK